MKKVCVVTSARSEYGVLRWVIDCIDKDENLQLQLIVTGGHLSPEQGLTYKAIIDDGYNIDSKVEMLLSSDSPVGISKSMGLCLIGISDTFDRLKPDIIVVLGDRYELLPIVESALIMKIPVAHISGGDVTEGAIDNEIRNAVTMMATLHFPGVEDSANNIRRMLGKNSNIYVVGEPGLDNFNKLSLMSRKELAINLQLNIDKKWILVTIHPETQESLEYNLNIAKNVKSILDSLVDINVIITKANTDLGGFQINKYWTSVAQENPQRYKLLSSLGQKRYLSFMKECTFVLGNSSSGIIEAPCLGIPVMNIGDRQQGRHLCKNIFQVPNDIDSMKKTCKFILRTKKKSFDNYYGDGHTSEKIVNIIKEYLYGNSNI